MGDPKKYYVLSYCGCFPQGDRFESQVLLLLEVSHEPCATLYVEVGIVEVVHQLLLPK